MSLGSPVEMPTHAALKRDGVWRDRSFQSTRPNVTCRSHLLQQLLSVRGFDNIFGWRVTGALGQRNLEFGNLLPFAFVLHLDQYFRRPTTPDGFTEKASRGCQAFA